MQANMKLKRNRKRPAKEIGAAVLSVTYFLMLPAMFVLPLISAADHSIAENTMYELADQSIFASVIIHVIIMVLAAGLVVTGWLWYKGFIFQKIFLLLFGLSLIMTALVSLHGMVTNVTQYRGKIGWYSYFINTAWLTFIILALSTSSILNNSSGRFWSVIAGLSGLLLTILVYEAEFAAGIWQRLLFIISFGWMIYTFRIPGHRILKKPGNGGRLLNT